MSDDQWVQQQMAQLGLSAAAPAEPRGEWLPVEEAGALHGETVAARRADNGGMIAGVLDQLRHAVAARHGQPVTVSHVLLEWAALDGQHVNGLHGSGQQVTGIYDHATRTVTPEGGTPLAVTGVRPASRFVKKPKGAPRTDIAAVNAAMAPGGKFDPGKHPRGYAGRWTFTHHSKARELHGQVVQGEHETGSVVGTYDHPTRSVNGKRVGRVRRLLGDLGAAIHDTGLGETVAPAGGLLPPARRTAETATASTVHEPVGKPGGPGLWGHKDWQLPAYIQHVANELRKSGHDESRAIGMAVGIVRNWAHGHTGRGQAVHPDVQAAATKAIAEWEALKARTAHGAKRSADMASYDADGLDASWDGPEDDLPDLSGLTIEDLNEAAEADPEFADWLAGGTAQRLAKLGSGARFAALKAKLAGHGIRDPGALAAHIGRQKYGKQRFHALARAARKRKAGPAVARSNGLVEMFRYWPLEECRVLTRRDGDEFGSGRFVEAYAAVFGQEAEIRDHEGHYLEDIDRAAFDDTLMQIHPDRNGGFWRATCLYNHGMTVHGTPAERFSLPAGLPHHISAEGKGLLTRTEYAATPLGEELLELVTMGALRSQSFTGGIIRSAPMLRGPGDKYRPVPGGGLTRVRRLQLGLREYGLTPFAAYSGAEVLGVRMQLPGDAWEDDDIDDAALIPDDGDGGGGPPEAGNASRSTSNRLYRLRTQEALERAGITLPGRAGEE